MMPLKCSSVDQTLFGFDISITCSLSTADNMQIDPFQADTHLWVFMILNTSLSAVQTGGTIFSL